MHITTKPVVVAIADKQASALRFAADAARARQAPLRVVHSTYVPPQATELYAGDLSSLTETFPAAGQALLDDARSLVHGFEPNLHADYVLTPLAPVAALMEEAAGAVVLVVGADDVPWFERLLRTKVAGHVAKHAPCPVVVVPELEFPTGADGDVVLTLDGATAAAGPIRFAFEAAAARSSVLHVLHATPSGTLRADEEVARMRLAEVLAGWRETYPDVAVLPGFSNDDPAAALIRATRGAELVVMGRPHDTSLPVALVRPLATKVLRQAECPVAVVPADYRGV